MALSALNSVPSVLNLFFSSLFSAFPQRPPSASQRYFFFSSLLLSTVNCQPSLKLHHQIRLPNPLQRYFHHPRLFPLQLHPYFSVRESRQPSLKKFRVPDRLARRNLRQPSHEPLKILRLLQRPIQPRRADLQNVSRPLNQLFHVQNHAQLLADPLAIRMTDLRVRFASRNVRAFRPRRNYSLGRRVRLRWLSLRYAVDIYPQEPLLPHFPFHINDFKPHRARHPLGGRANPLQIHVEPPRPKPVSSAPQPASTKKWACAHSSVRPLQSEFTVYSPATAKARHPHGQNDKRPGAQPRGVTKGADALPLRRFRGRRLRSRLLRCGLRRRTGRWRSTLRRIRLIVQLHDVLRDVDVGRGKQDGRVLRGSIENRHVPILARVAIKHVDHFAADAIENFGLRGVYVFLIFVLLALQLPRLGFAFALQTSLLVLAELAGAGVEALAQIVDLFVQSF